MIKEQRKSWNIGILEDWNNGIMEWWNIGESTSGMMRWILVDKYYDL
jgi:hypothetical protein